MEELLDSDHDDADETWSAIRNTHEAPTADSFSVMQETSDSHTVPITFYLSTDSVTISQSRVAHSSDTFDFNA